jgi:hypothetical protein
MSYDFDMDTWKQKLLLKPSIKDRMETPVLLPTKKIRFVESSTYLSSEKRHDLLERIQQRHWTKIIHDPHTDNNSDKSQSQRQRQSDSEKNSDWRKLSFSVRFTETSFPHFQKKTIPWDTANVCIAKMETMQPERLVAAVFARKTSSELLKKATTYERKLGTFLETFLTASLRAVSNRDAEEVRAHAHILCSYLQRLPSMLSRGLFVYTPFESSVQTCATIAIAEGFQPFQKIILLTTTYRTTLLKEQIKRYIDLVYTRNQHWKFVSLDSSLDNPNDLVANFASALGLSESFVKKQNGIWVGTLHTKKETSDKGTNNKEIPYFRHEPSSYEYLSEKEKHSLNQQLDHMINNKYTVNAFSSFTDESFKEDLYLCESVVLIDEAHILVSDIETCLSQKKDRKIFFSGANTDTKSPVALCIYHWLMRKKNIRIRMFSSCPIVQTPNDFGILFNLLRGYITTWNFPLQANTKTDLKELERLLVPFFRHDYVQFVSSTKVLKITRNPFFMDNTKTKGNEGNEENEGNEKNKENKETKRHSTMSQLVVLPKSNAMSDAAFESRVLGLLKKQDLEIKETKEESKKESKKESKESQMEILRETGLPDTFDEFTEKYLNDETFQLKNRAELFERIAGLSICFAQTKKPSKINMHLQIVHIYMSDLQFQCYEDARKKERRRKRISKSEAGSEKKVHKGKPPRLEDVYRKDVSARVISFFLCNYVVVDRPLPSTWFAVVEGGSRRSKKDKKDKTKLSSKEEKEEKNEKTVSARHWIEEDYFEDDASSTDDETTKNEILASSAYFKKKISENEPNEGDAVLLRSGGKVYKTQLQETIREMCANPTKYFSPEALKTFSPKFLVLLSNIQNSPQDSLHLVYSQFETMEGIELFRLVLEANGYCRFQIRKNASGRWVWNESEVECGKPRFLFFSDQGNAEENEILRCIFNSEWEKIPESLHARLKKIAYNNRQGQIIQVLLTTSCFLNTAMWKPFHYVHMIDPCRVQNILSHFEKDPYYEDERQKEEKEENKENKENQENIQVFFYLMKFTETQEKKIQSAASEEDFSILPPYDSVVTTDEKLFQCLEIQAKISGEFLSVISDSCF